jgi:hypothetical protein
MFIRRHDPMTLACQQGGARYVHPGGTNPVLAAMTMFRLGESQPVRVGYFRRGVPFEVTAHLLPSRRADQHSPCAVDHRVHLMNARDPGLVAEGISRRPGHQEDRQDEIGEEPLAWLGCAETPKKSVSRPVRGNRQVRRTAAEERGDTIQPSPQTRAQAAPAPRPCLPGEKRTPRRPGGISVCGRAHRAFHTLATMVASRRRLGATG